MTGICELPDQKLVTAPAGAHRQWWIRPRGEILFWNCV